MSTTQSTADFIGVSDFDGDTQVVPIKSHLLGGGYGSLFGGVGVATALITLERMTGQPPVYMTCQFASTVVPPAQLTFLTEILAKGKTVSQGRVTAVSDGQVILTLVGATGLRNAVHEAHPSTMPTAPAPEELVPLGTSREVASLHDHVEVRMARGAFGFASPETEGRGTFSGDGSTLFWTRMPGVTHDAAALSLMADYLPSSVGNAVQQHVTCSSLDNTVRFAGPIEPDASSEWVLCESHVDVVAAGFAINRGFLWSRDGRLLASANQSVTVARPRVA